ncbi:hypothetical protein SLS53_003171 [Cytospora paraplurivora]|uniref:L-lysine 2,3-aminomutase n=1 Tax=Cytospora paraplurivora TaxID=2898453 RepID=A0AAN9UKA0_9PEZI
MATTAMFGRVISRQLARSTVARIPSLQLKRGAASAAVAQVASQVDGPLDQHPWREEFWRRVPVYENVATRDFISYRWSIRNTVQGQAKLWQFLNSVVPNEIPMDKGGMRTQSKEDFLVDVVDGVTSLTMSIRLTSYAVGADTETVTKTSFAPTRKRWDQVFAYIESTPQLQDIVISGGDSYYLQPEHIRMIADRLIAIPHIRRFRFASKGLAVAPTRLLDPEDGWADALIDVSRKAKFSGKSVALHTHFNHPNEFSWITGEAAQRLVEADVTIRNQSVLLRGVNDDAETMSKLIRSLADNRITPYYVYICDMVKMNEHMRTPLQTLLDVEAQIRGSIAGFMMPQFVVDLPGGGGKRLGCTYESYDRKTGISRFVAPAVTAATGGRGRGKPEVFEYYDPILPAP